MKIIYKNAEFGYQQPIINNIDVLGEANIEATTTQRITLTGNLSSYARIIVTLTLAYNNDATNSVDLTYEDFKAGKTAAFHYGGDDQGVRAIYVNDTTVEVTTAGYGEKHVKIEGVKRTSQVSNLGTWEDITSKCTFGSGSGLSASNTRVFANPLFIAIYVHGSITISSNTSWAISLPSAYAFKVGSVSISTGNPSYASPGLVPGSSSSKVSTMNTTSTFTYLWWVDASNAASNRTGGGLLLRA